MNRLYAALVLVLVVTVSVASLTSPVSAQERRFFRIGTGSISGVYFPVGGLIASAISHPPGESLCGQGGSCGVPGLVAVAQASRGSVVNARNIGSGSLESALVQSDIAYRAVKGLGEFSGKRAVSGLRAIASLYSEVVQVVVRKDSRIGTIAELKGKRVSLDLKGSGTRAVALRVLKGYGLDPEALRQVNSQVGPAVDRLKSRRIDALFFVGGLPTPSLNRLAADVPLRLVPIEGEMASAIREADPFLSGAVIPVGTYGVGAEVRTLSVGALWVVSDKVGADLVYRITKALWHPVTRSIFRHGPEAARQIRLKNALKGVAIPLHPGAVKFYREKGLIKKTPPPDGAAPTPKVKDQSKPAPAPAATP